MTQINPKEVIHKGIISNITKLEEQTQQNGVDLTIKETITLPAKSFLNVEVNEHFNMQDCFGLIIIRSSLSRKGVFCSSGVYDSGFVGVGGVSLYNLSDTQQVLSAGMRIAQILVFQGDPAKLYDGEYNKNCSIKSKLD